MQLQHMLAERQKGLKEEQVTFTKSWVCAMLATDGGGHQAPSLEQLTEASDRHLLEHMAKYDDPWLQQWKGSFGRIIMKPGDDVALTALQRDLEQVDSENAVSDDVTEDMGAEGGASSTDRKSVV